MRKFSRLILKILIVVIDRALQVTNDPFTEVKKDIFNLRNYARRIILNNLLDEN